MTLPAEDQAHLSKQTLDLVEKTLDDAKAEDIVVIDLNGKTTIADYMVIASGRSSRQVAAMADRLMRRLKEEGVDGVAAEGMTQGDWVLIDSGDVLVHLFRPEVRDFYNIEKMWKVEAKNPGKTSEPVRISA